MKKLGIGMGEHVVSCRVEDAWFSKCEICKKMKWCITYNCFYYECVGCFRKYSWNKKKFPRKIIRQYKKR